MSKTVRGMAVIPVPPEGVRFVTSYTGIEHPLESTPKPEPRLIDAAPVIQDLKAMLRKMRPMEDFDAGKRAGIRYALDLLKIEIGEPF